MLTLRQCKVITEDDVHTDIDDGRVTVVGESPNATVRISVPDYEAKKFIPVDTLTKVSFTRKGDTWSFAGRSKFMAEVIGSPDASLSFDATPAPGCADCHDQGPGKRKR